MKAKIIKTEEEYQEALDYLSTLMNAEPGSPQEEDLELFAMLIEQYEKEQYPIDLPDPVEAILFRMDQQGLTRKDLQPYIGSQSKVSEVLSRKRPLSLNMVRAIHEGLDIPYEVLLKEPGRELKEQKYDPRIYPFAEMLKRGYFMGFSGSLAEAREYGEELLEKFFGVFKSMSIERALCRNSDNPMDEYALAAWQARVMALAGEISLPAYQPEQITVEFARAVIRLSYLGEGPRLAQELLHKRGIPFIILPHLPKTYLDGACFCMPDGRPVIGLTLRHDRLDNFWFTLAHELAHVILHLKTPGRAFFDEIEHGVHHSCSPEEIDANQLASDLLIPTAIWESEKASLLLSQQEFKLVSFANRLGISPAIVAGRIRWERNDYQIYTRLVGNKTLAKLFATEGAQA